MSCIVILFLKISKNVIFSNMNNIETYKIFSLIYTL